MLTKGDMTKISILEAAKELFSEKGYSAVTMNDFCERARLSRGGLYRHFASTKEIFTAMLDFDKENAIFELKKAISEGVPAIQMLFYMLKTKKAEIQKGEGRLSIAVYEFCTTEPDKMNYLDNRFKTAVDSLAMMISYGHSRGEFAECDAKETAMHIVIFLEGLRVSSAVVQLSDAALEEQFIVLCRILGVRYD